MKNTHLAFLLIITLLVFACTDNGDFTSSSKSAISEPINWNNEIIYHVMPRSFYDSNGDRHGDLNGVVEKLDYLLELGVTTILFTPLYESEFYHNYFPKNYENIDPEYGTRDDYLNFIRAVHARGLKFIMDMETQYTCTGHEWFDDSFKNPESEFSKFVYYSDSLNAQPEQLFMPRGYPLIEFPAWPDGKFNIVILDLNNTAMIQWQNQFYTHWVDPNGDGKFDDGVDGFRIDHIMDDLDNKGVVDNLYKDFWGPLFDTCRSINPNLFIVGEQANWLEYGDEMVKGSKANAAFNFKLKAALRGESGINVMLIDNIASNKTIDPERVYGVMDTVIQRFPTGSFYVNFVENHDTDRWASLMAHDERLMRLGSGIPFLLPGIPSIYYGQELGLTGVKGDWGSDANDLPRREPFPWEPSVDAKGIASFYMNTGEWWDVSLYNNPDALIKLALSTQRQNPNSMWNYYRSMIKLRKSHEALRSGTYEPIRHAGEGIFAFKRITDDTELYIIANLSDQDKVIPTEIGDMLPEASIFGNFADPDGYKIDAYGLIILE